MPISDAVVELHCGSTATNLVSSDVTEAGVYFLCYGFSPVDRPEALTIIARRDGYEPCQALLQSPNGYLKHTIVLRRRE